jgi:hypothetical protein
METAEAYRQELEALPVVDTGELPFALGGEEVLMKQ